MVKFLSDFSGPYEPSNLNACQRYEVLTPIIGEATETYMDFLRFMADPDAPDRSDDIDKKLGELFQNAADRNGEMSVEEVRRAFVAFTGMGLPGLMTPIPLHAGRVAKSFNGTWEMRHRFTDGGRTPYANELHNTTARSHIYYDLYDETNNRLRQLTTMWTLENHYPRKEACARDMAGRSSEEQTFLLSALIEIEMKQIDPWTVEYTDDGWIYGNHGEFMNGVHYRSKAYMMRFGASESLIGVPVTNLVLPDGTEAPARGMFVLLNVLGGGPTALSFPMSGVPRTAGDLPTLDTVDNYTKVNSDRPLIGGFEPIEVYFERMRDPDSFVRQAADASDRFGAESKHCFYPQAKDSLHKFRRKY